MSGDFPVALIFVLGAVAVPFLRGRLRTAYMLLLPLIAFAYLLALPYGEFGPVSYTHLDVYKRQTVCRNRAAVRKTPWANLP